mmetsp:Transcript_6509/g.14199  ORF Transcript_6509/g.14199 Transcript_6509/m.14199 type:complete len:206 (-) Transcript_6509:744-1361(-)
MASTPGSTLARQIKSGSTKKEMKPTWHLATSTVCESQFIEIGRPSARSASPCAKNSLITPLIHTWYVSRGRVGLLMSEALMMRCCRSAAEADSPEFKRALRLFTKGIVEVTSVASTRSITRLRSVLASAGSIWARKSFSGCESSAMAVAAWWLSSTDVSLYSNASGCLVAIKNGFITPGWSVSCTIAASSCANVWSGLSAASAAE